MFVPAMRLFSVVLIGLCVVTAKAQDSDDFQEPDLGSGVYSSPENPFAETSGNQCTWYVYGRVKERLGINLAFAEDSERHAYRWSEVVDDRYERGQEPRAGAIAVWGPRVDGDHFGHVAYVEHVYGGVVFYTEANFSTFREGGGYDGRVKYETRSVFEDDKGRNQAYEFVTYIYPTENSVDEPGQLIAGHFSGVVVATEESLSGVSEGDLVVVDLQYHTEPEEVGHVPERGATGYYFVGDPSRAAMVVRIGNHEWSSGAKLEILVMNDRPDSGPDMVRFAAFQALGSSVDQTARVQFLLSDRALTNLLSGTNLPTSLSDLDFAGAGDPDCCFIGIIESDAAPHYPTTLVKVDRSTFQLSRTSVNN